MKPIQARTLLLLGHFLILSGCVSMESNKRVELAELPISFEKDIEYYAQKKITTAMAASEKAEPTTYNLKEKSLYDCIAEYGNGVTGKYFNKAYVISGLNGSIILNQSNPNRYFSTSSKVEEHEGTLRLFTPNYKFDWSSFNGETIKSIGGVNYNCEKSKNTELFKHDVIAENDITYAMSYDLTPIATITTTDSLSSREHVDAEKSKRMRFVVDRALINSNVDIANELGSTTMTTATVLSGLLTIIGPILEENNAFDEAKQFSCKLVKGKGLSLETWNWKLELKESVIGIKATKSFVYFTDSEGTKKLKRGLFHKRVYNANDLLIIHNIDENTKKVTKKAILDCSI